MQKIHPVLAWLILMLLIVHLVVGSVTLFTGIFPGGAWLRYLFAALVAAHAVLALGKAFGRRGRLRAHFAYGRENRRYWLRVGSGCAVALLFLVHRTLWTVQTPFGVLPCSFGLSSLVVQLLFVAALAVHILLNIRPLLLDCAIEPSRRAMRWAKTIGALLAALSVVSAAAYFMGATL